MSLPEALLKRLAKRGIIPDGNKVGVPGSGSNQSAPAPAAASASAARSGDEEDSEHEKDQDDNLDNSSDESEADKDDDAGVDRRDAEIANEEIIAEDYDEYDQVNPEAFEYASKKKSTPAAEWTEKMKQKMTKRYGYQSVDGCQNKYNIHHLCSMYCVKRYGEVEFEIEKEYDKRTKRLLERYPLPKNWRKEYDIGCKAFYFYNKDTRVVAWLPPTHPDAKLTKSAKQLRRELMEEQKQKEAGPAEVTPTTVDIETSPHPPPVKPMIGPSNTTAQVMPSVGPTENLKPPIVNPPKRPSKQHPPGERDENEKRQRTFSNGNESAATAAAAASESGTIDVVDRDRDYRERNRDRRDRDRDRDRERERDRRDRDRDRSPPPARGEDGNRFGGRDRERNRDRDRDRERDYREHRDHRRQPRGPPKSAPLDPMDPAAYSDIPRGTWSAGLEAQSQSASSKKQDKKDERKKAGQSTKPAGDDCEDDEGAHEVLKVSTVQEFRQHENDDDDGDGDGDDDDDDDDDVME